MMGMRKKARRHADNIVMVLARPFSRGAAAYAPVAFPGRITFTGFGNVGLDNIAPVQREFIFGAPASADYRHDLINDINPAEARFETGDMRGYPLMPSKKQKDPKWQKGGDYNAYDYEADVFDEGG